MRDADAGKVAEAMSAAKAEESTGGFKPSGFKPK
jgi:hypothetical protein